VRLVNLAVWVLLVDQREDDQFWEAQGESNFAHVDKKGLEESVGRNGRRMTCCVRWVASVPIW